MEEQHDLAKWLAGEMTQSELEAFERSADFETYKKIKELSGQMDLASANLEFEKAAELRDIIEDIKSKM